VLAIAVGDDWSEGADAAQRAWAQLDVWSDNDEILMGFIDPIAHHDEAHFGLPLSREKVLLDRVRMPFLKWLTRSCSETRGSQHYWGRAGVASPVRAVDRK
jgi:hypothetical protein